MPRLERNIYTFFLRYFGPLGRMLHISLLILFLILIQWGKRGKWNYSIHGNIVMPEHTYTRTFTFKNCTYYPYWALSTSECLIPWCTFCLCAGVHLRWYFLRFVAGVFLFNYCSLPLHCNNIDRLCGLVVRVSGYLHRGTLLPEFSEQQWVWNGVHSASWTIWGATWKKY
jgi:hypothetical protein